MDKTWNLIRVARLRVRLCAMLVLAAFVGWASSSQSMQCTPDGVQCPTAAVQTVAQAIKCCGKLVGYTERALRPGDKGFVQCRCAEKRATQQKASVDQVSTHVVMLCSNPVTFNVPARSSQTAPTATPAPALLSVHRSPSVPPPSLL